MKKSQCRPDGDKYFQILCKNGHLQQPDASEEIPNKCPSCGEPFCWHNYVDESNEIDHPRVVLKLLGYSEPTPCPTCGEEGGCAPSYYKIPWKGIGKHEPPPMLPVQGLYPHEKEITELLEKLLPLVTSAYSHLQDKDSQLDSFPEMQEATVACRKARIALNRHNIKQEKHAIKAGFGTESKEEFQGYDGPEFDKLYDAVGASEERVRTLRTDLSNADPSLHKIHNFRKLLIQIEVLLERK